jgi:hypothetical protein
MQTECITDRFDFAPVEKRAVVAGFDGGTITSDAGALLLGLTDRAIGLVGRFARCFVDVRNAALIEHAVTTLVGQRIFAIALGYEDLNDHDELRHDRVMAVLAGKLEARRHKKCAAVAGKSTLNRLELSRPTPSRYHKISHDPAAIEALFVELFLGAHAAPPDEIVLDLDATDDPLHGNQEGRFFHGYYGNYCYLPLYIFCGDHLLCAKLRPANIDAAAGALEEVERIVRQLRQRWPKVRIVLRADSGFAREELMAWCENNAVDYLFGLARNVRLARHIGAELEQAKAESSLTGRPARRFKDFLWTTRKSLYEERQYGTVVRVTFLLSVGCCGIHGLSPIAKTRLVAKPDPTYIRSLFETAAPTSRLRRTRAQEDETILERGHFKPNSCSVRPTWIPSGLIRSWGWE